MPTVAFDVIGTLFNMERPRERLAELGAPGHALDLWFAQALRDAVSFSHAGAYLPLGEFLEAALRRLAAVLGLGATEEELRGVVRSFRELDPRPEAGEACGMFAEAGWTIFALTNGSDDITRALLERGGFIGRFDALLSCDAVRKTKPHPDVYAMASDRADGELWLVAAHAWDCAGANRAGLRTAWVSSVETEYLGAYPPPDVVAGDLVEAARLVLERAGNAARPT